MPSSNGEQSKTYIVIQFKVQDSIPYSKEKFLDDNKVTVAQLHKQLYNKYGPKFGFMGWYRETV